MLFRSNCIILGRAESYASKNPPVESIFDGMGTVSYTHLNGVTVINDLDELSSHEKGVMIIRSHGISKAEYDLSLIHI